MQEKSIYKSYILDPTTAILNKWSSLSVLINQDYPAYELFKEALPIIWRFSVVLLFLDKRTITDNTLAVKLRAYAPATFLLR